MKMYGVDVEYHFLTDVIFVDKCNYSSFSILIEQIGNMSFNGKPRMETQLYSLAEPYQF